MPQNGTGFINLQDVLAQNRGAGRALADTLRSRASRLGGDKRQKFQSAYDEWSKGATADSREEDFDQFLRDKYGEAAMELLDAESEAQALKSQSGRAALMQRGTYGQRGLDSFLAGAEGEADLTAEADAWKGAGKAALEQMRQRAGERIRSLRTERERKAAEQKAQKEAEDKARADEAKRNEPSTGPGPATPPPRPPEQGGGGAVVDPELPGEQGGDKPGPAVPRDGRPGGPGRPEREAPVVVDDPKPPPLVGDTPPPAAPPPRPGGPVDTGGAVGGPVGAPPPRAPAPGRAPVGPRVPLDGEGAIGTNPPPRPPPPPGPATTPPAPSAPRPLTPRPPTSLTPATGLSITQALNAERRRRGGRNPLE